MRKTYFMPILAVFIIFAMTVFTLPVAKASGSVTATPTVTTSAKEKGDKDKEENQKVTICHSTSSTKNPFVKISISMNGWINAHSKHHDGKDKIADNGDCEKTSSNTSTDVCPNLSGVQKTVPEGYEIKNKNCVVKEKGSSSTSENKAVLGENTSKALPVTGGSAPWSGLIALVAGSPLAILIGKRIH